jgi:hypothetical protein
MTIWIGLVTFGLEVENDCTLRSQANIRSNVDAASEGSHRSRSVTRSRSDPPGRHGPVALSLL